MHGNSYLMGGFWTGVVEDRMDPLFLGRCRVRIIGVHTADKNRLPTADLPWAFPVQPITSAAMNGIGSAPVGPVEGTNVVGFFRDGEECQEPVILGTLGGIPQPESPTTQAQSTPVLPSTIGTPDGQQQVDTKTNAPVTSSSTTASTPSSGVLGALTQDDLDASLKALRQRESSSNYSLINEHGYMGAYQISAENLEDLGYVNAGSKIRWENAAKDDFAFGLIEQKWITQSIYDRGLDTDHSNFNFYVLNQSLWTAKAGGSLTAFLIQNPSLQDKAVQELWSNNYKDLVRRKVLNSNSTKEDIAGALFGAHLGGVQGVTNYFLSNRDKADSNSTYISDYVQLGRRAVNPSASVASSPLTSPPPSAPIATNVALVKAAGSVRTAGALGFTDPNKVYPKIDFIGEPDTNRLARHQDLQNTIVAKKDDARITGVDVAFGGDKWDQPVVPYNAEYPYNHIFESESGHLMEFDDTPHNERIHQYHKAGTFTEIDRNGTRVTRIIGDDYTILERNGNVYIQGRANVTINGECNILVGNDCHLEVGGSLKARVHKDFDLNVAGDGKMVFGGSLDIKAGDNVDIESGRNMNLKTLNAFKVGGLKVSLSADLTMGFEALTMVSMKTPIFMCGALTFNVITMPHPVAIVAPGIGPSSASVDSPTDKFDPAETRFPALPIPNRAEETVFALSALAEHPTVNADAIKSLQQELVDSGAMTKQQVTAPPNINERDNTPSPPKPSASPGPCGDLSGVTDFPDTFPLSTNYTLGDLSTKTRVSHYKVVAQNNLTAAAIVCNLRNMATTQLENIRLHYGNVAVNSGFRTPGHGEATAGISQHEFGQAMDLVFDGAQKADYYSIAQWIRDNIVFDQLILEAHTAHDGGVWIHISYHPTRQRSPQSKILTLHNGQTVASGELVQMF